MLYATVRQRKIYVKKPTTVIQNGVGVDELTLDMDAEWGSMDSIICVFTLKYTESTSTTETGSDGNSTTKITTETKEITKQMLHTYGTTLLVPWECLVKTGLLSVSCTGYVGSTKIMTTMLPDSFWNVVQNGAITGDETIDPTPTLYQQIVAAAGVATTAAAAANNAASEIKAAAAAGEYDGKTPTVRIGSTTTGATGSEAQVTNSGTSTDLVLNFTIPRGTQGTQGAPGVSPTISIGKVETLETGAAATATMTGTTKNPVLNLGIPKGDAGAPGTAPTITATKSDKTTTISVDGKAVAEIKDGENGTDGDDGYSPSAKVEKSGTVTTVKITDKSGTTTAEVKDGGPGTDGTSVTISKISESTDDGGSNVVTFNDGKTLTVKNGNKGSDGVTPSLSIGTVETLAAGSDATASITGTDEKPVLNLGIPKGADGSGGGSGGVAKTTLASFTLEEDLTNYATLKVSLSDNPFKFSQVLVSITAQQADDSGQYQTYLYGADGSMSQVAHLNTRFSKSAVKSWFITASIFKSYVSAIASENVDGYMWTNQTQYSFVYTRKTESHTENYLKLSNMSAKAGMTVTVEGI